MSTKNLARTVIEGGRYRSGSQLCRYKNRALRTRTRVAPGDVASGRDADDLTIRPVWKVGRRFHDKLGPSVRWLASQVGRPWDLVRGELVRKFDPRTTAGRHIVFDHMLPSIHGEDKFGCCEDRFGCHHTFLIDRHGLLRRVRSRPRAGRGRPNPCPAPSTSSARGWAAGAWARMATCCSGSRRPRPAATASTTVSPTPTPRSGDPFPTGSGRATIHWRRPLVIPNGGADMPSITIKGRNVPIELWAPIEEVDTQVITQLKNVAALPWVAHHVAVMPDVHLGKGATVGSVIAMHGAVAPAAVGVDIGCGMAAVKTSLTSKDLPDDLRRAAAARSRTRSRSAGCRTTRPRGSTRPTSCATRARR